MPISTLPSICIPRVFANITRKHVSDAFERVLGRNCIERIDMINYHPELPSKSTAVGVEEGRESRFVPATKKKRSCRIYHPDGLDGYQRVFVHFRNMKSSSNYVIMSKRLREGKDVNVVYSEPWFWKCSVSRVPKPNRY